MSKRKIGLALSLLLAAGTILGACGKDKDTGKTGNNNESEFSVAMVTDVGGVDDKSFNQSAWKGIKDFGAANNLTEGDGGYAYLQSEDESDYNPNLNRLVRRGFDLIFGVGFMMEADINKIAEENPDAMFSIIDSVVDQPNVASIMFKEQEGAFLAGVAAALMTKSNKLGFVGGAEIPVIERFEAGFLAGVKAVDPSIEVDVNYTGFFDKAEIGKATANLMYKSGVDIIFHAAGGTGNGVFAEAKEIKQANPDAYVWVIGVDSDQYDEGQVGSDNITLTSMLKRVDNAVVNISELAAEGKFPGGETITYGLADEGIGLADSRGAIPADVDAKIKEFAEKIANGEIVVPADPAEVR